LLDPCLALDRLPAFPELRESGLHVRDQEVPIDPRSRLFGVFHTRGLSSGLQRDLFEVVGNRGLDPVSFLNEPGQFLLGAIFPMNQEKTHGLCPESAEPIEKLTLPRVGGKAVDREDLCTDGDILVEDPHLLGAVDDLTARRSLCLEADKNDARPVSPEVVTEMVLDPAGIRHSACRDHHGRSLSLVDFHRFLRLERETKPGQLQGIFSFRKQGFRLSVHVFPGFAEDLRRLDRQRAVHENGHVGRQTAFLRKQVQRVDHLLRPPHGKGRDDHLFAPAVAVDDGLGELVQAVLLVLVVPVSVGRLHKEVVCLLDHRRIPDDELRRTADVAGEDDTVGLAVLRDHELDHRRAEDMARVPEGRRDPLSGGKGLVVIHGRE